MYKKRALFFSMIFWPIFIGLLFIIRFFGTGLRHDFLDTFWELIIYWFLSSIFLGVIFWLGLLFENHRKIRRMPYYLLSVIQAAILLISVFLFTVLFTLAVSILKGIPIDEAIEGYISWLVSPLFISAVIYIFASAIIIEFIWQMVMKNGPSVLINLMLGKYHNPREEDRIFMFIDMKSSTTIAEKIGHIKYSRLIQDCFADLTESAIKYKVEIYQYIGDEAVLTWKSDKGRKHNNCIYAFFHFQQTLLDKSDYYLSRYDIVPEFKAGINSGMVIVTEVGIIKKEIAYHSDVLNTAARIQGKCNDLNSQLLISEEVKESLIPDNNLIFEDVGIFELRGKQIGVRLFNVTQTGIPKHLR
jgi:adenylate cyclase